jgi:toxin ParE1/3/4
MSLEVIELQEAYEDITDIAAYLLVNASRDVMYRFLTATLSAYKRIAEMPESGSPRSYEGPDYRNLRMWLVPGFPNHLIFYRIRDARIEIVRVLHAARDIEQIFSS